MDRRFCEILKQQLSFWGQEIMLSTKNLFYLFPPKLYLPAWLIKTASEVVFFACLGYMAAGEEGAYFAMIGNCVAVVGRSIIARGSGLIANEKWMGTLPYIIIAPFHMFRFMIGRNILNLLEGLTTSIILFFLLGTVFGLFTQSFVMYLTYIPILLLIALSMVGLSTIIAGITFYVRTSMYISSTFWVILMIFSGMTFPIDLLPSLMQKVSFCLPMTNGILAVRALLAETVVGGEVMKYVLYEFCVGVGYILTGIVVMKAMIGLSLRKGNLDAF